jgi:para-nitrobenzyl esterase
MGVDEPVSRMHGVQGASVWSYRFDWDEEPSVLGTDLSKLIGAGHAVEMIFVFGLTDLGFANRFLFADPPSAQALSDQMRSYWSEFAHTLRPGKGQGGDLPNWPAWNPGAGEPKYLIFDGRLDGGLEVGTDWVDQAFVLARASRDPRLLDDEERCRVFRNFVQWSGALSLEDYADVMGGACRRFPLKSRLFFPSLEYSNEAN